MEELGRGLEFARARNERWCDENLPDVPDAAELAPAEALDLDDEDRVVPMETLARTLAALDQATEMLTKITASGGATDPTLLAAARKCAAHTASVAGGVREELGLDDGGKVVSISIGARSTTTAN